VTLLRLTYVTRRFRPLPGGLENVACRLLSELAKRGNEVHVVTPRWQPEWPIETDYAGVRVVRIEPPAGRCWAEGRYARRLVKALERLTKRGDDRPAVAIVSGLKHDAQTVVLAGRAAKFPVVLQPEGPGIGGDCHWQIEARGGNRVKHRCYRADRVLALTPLLQRELTAAGYPRTRICEVPIGLPQVAPNTPQQKYDARRSLAHVDPALVLPQHAQVVVYVGTLRLGKGLATLIDAWRAVAATRPHAILWLTGEGPDAGSLRERVFEYGLARSVSLTGAFDDVEDLFRAADVAVYPSIEDGLGVGALEAATYGLPLVAGDTSTHREFFAADTEASLVPKHDAAALAAALGTLLDDDALARQRGNAARTRVERDHSLAAMVDAYERILLETIERKPAEVRA
jgi:glycosyltransferase involved in cell wall biosynthesis